jgi:hypothetical protein
MSGFIPCNCTYFEGIHSKNVYIFIKTTKTKIILNKVKSKGNRACFQVWNYQLWNVNGNTSYAGLTVFLIPCCRKRNNSSNSAFRAKWNLQVPVFRIQIPRIKARPSSLYTLGPEPVWSVGILKNRHRNCYVPPYNMDSEDYLCQRVSTDL